MNRGEWEKRIKKMAKDAGTYRPCFDEAIRTLAGMLENRDIAEEEYKRLGSKPVIKYTNKGGSTNPTKNPLLVVVDDLNKTALSYWRDLGLTPAGLKKLKEDALKDTVKKSFSDVIEGL